MINELKRIKRYIYYNYEKDEDELINRYMCRTLIVTNIYHILLVYAGILLPIFMNDKKILIIILFMYVWFFFSAFYSAGCWIALPEIMLKKKYKCSDNYKLSKTIWTIRDFLLPRLLTTMVIYTILFFYVLYKLFK